MQQIRTVQLVVRYRSGKLRQGAISCGINACFKSIENRGKMFPPKLEDSKESPLVELVHVRMNESFNRKWMWVVSRGESEVSAETSIEGAREKDMR